MKLDQSVFGTVVGVACQTSTNVVVTQIFTASLTGVFIYLAFNVAFHTLYRSYHDG